MRKARSALAKAFGALRAHALGYPEAREDFPWGESAFKVRNKVFLFMSTADEILRLSLKLPYSREFALQYPFTEPTGYGLGKSGWVTSTFARGAAIPLDILQAWIAESYAAIAPRRLSSGLSAPASSPKPGRKR